MPRINFLSVQDPSISNQSSIQELENMFLEPSKEPMKAKFILRGRDGSSIKNTNYVAAAPDYSRQLSGSRVNGQIYVLASTGMDATNIISNTGEILTGIVVDTFDDASETPLDSHTSNIGDPWVKRFSNASITNLIVDSSFLKTQNETLPNTNAFYTLSNSAFFNTLEIDVGGYKLLEYSNTTYGQASGLSVGFYQDAGNMDVFTVYQSKTLPSCLAVVRSIRASVVESSVTTSFSNSTIYSDGLDLSIRKTTDSLGQTSIVVSGLDLSDKFFGVASPSLVHTNIVVGYDPFNPFASTLTNVINASISNISVNVSQSPQVFGSYVQNPAHTVVVYRDSSTSNFYFGSVVDGEIVHAVNMSPTIFGSASVPTEVAAGSSNIMFSGSGSNFVVTEADLSNAIFVTKPGNGLGGSLEYLGSVYYYSPKNTDLIYASDLLDPTSWPVSRYARAEYLGDHIRALMVFKDSLYVFGGQSIEVWYQTGNADFPLGRLPNGIIPLGIVEKALTKTQNAMYAVGFSKGSLGVWKVVDLSVTKISTWEIDDLLTRTFRVSSDQPHSLYMTSYQQDLHSFVLLNQISPSSNQCFVFDELTSTWHKRTLNGADYPIAWVVPDNYSLRGSDRYAIAAGPYTKSILELKGTNLTDFVDLSEYSYKKKMVSHKISGEDKNLFHSKFRLDTDRQSNANVSLLVKEHNEANFVSMGDKSLDTRFVEWWRLGSSSERVYGVETNANIIFTVVDAFVEVIPGSHSGGRQ